MIILKCTVSKDHNLLKNNNTNKRLRGALDNNLTFKFYNRSVHSNIKTYSTILKLANENLLCLTCVRRRQHMRVLRLLNTYLQNIIPNTSILYFVK